jgi:hypothetical protein
MTKYQRPNLRHCHAKPPLFVTSATEQFPGSGAGRNFAQSVHLLCTKKEMQGTVTVAENEFGRGEVGPVKVFWKHTPFETPCILMVSF